MSEKELVAKEKLQFKGIWDFKGMYSFAHGWLVEEGYGVSEDKYSEKVSTNKKDMSIEWKAAKVLGDYFKDEMKVEMKVEDLEEVEVEIDGKTKKMNRGSIEIVIKSSMIKDYKHVWESPGFSRVFKEFYNKYLFKDRIDKIEDIVRGSAQAFKESLKGYLEISGKR